MLICDKVFSNSASEQPCKLMHYSHLLFNKVWETEEHSHPLCEIAYILSGLGEYVQNGVSVPVKKGDLFIMNAYTPHFERSSPADPLEHIFFSIDIIGFEEKIKAQMNKYCTMIYQNFCPTLPNLHTHLIPRSNKNLRYGNKICSTVFILRSF